VARAAGPWVPGAREYSRGVTGRNDASSSSRILRADGSRLSVARRRASWCRRRTTSRRSTFGSTANVSRAGGVAYNTEVERAVLTGKFPIRASRGDVGCGVDLPSRATTEPHRRENCAGGRGEATLPARPRGAVRHRAAARRSVGGQIHSLSRCTEAASRKGRAARTVEYFSIYD